MKPSERAKALCDEFGIFPTYEDYCKRAEAFIEAAEREAFEAGYMMNQNCQEVYTTEAMRAALEDWRNREDD